MNPTLPESYARAIQLIVRPLRNCFGFIDGTVTPFCRPDENQRVVHNGHKRVYGLELQSVVLLNGTIANLYGPVGDSFKLS